MSTNALLGLAQTNGNLISLTISNAGDQVWLIQSSPDLVNWAKVESLKVFNDFFIGVTRTAEARIFITARFMIRPIRPFPTR